jgi:hypothetical protein
LPARPRRGGDDALASGWAPLDAVLAHGGLVHGALAALHADPGAGALALASSWAQAASRAGEPVAAIDALGSTLPHPWVEPRGARAPIWVIAPPSPREAWAALDLALRSGAFGLVIALDLPAPPPPGAGARLRRLARDHATRVIVAGAPPFTPDLRIQLRADRVEWLEGPTGAAPDARWLALRCTADATSISCEVRRDDALTDRLHPAPRAPDRRAAHGRPGRARIGKR